MLAILIALATAQPQDPGALGSQDMQSAGYVATGPAVASPTAGRRQVAVRVPMTHRSWGRLSAPVDMPRHRIDAGALVYRTRFVETGAVTGLVYDAWCGQGQIKRFFNFSPGVVCVVDTADGRATATEGLTDGAWWNPTRLASIGPDRLDRPAPTPSQSDAVPMTLELSIFAIEADTVIISRRLLDRDGRITGSQPILWLPVENNVATYAIPGYSVELRPSADRQSVETTTAPVDPAKVNAALAQARLDQEQARQLTPFVIGGAKLDLARMTVTSGVVERRNVLFSGPAQRARTGRIERATQATGGVRIAEGAIWHYVEQPTGDTAGVATQQGYWCGPSQIVSILGTLDAIQCAGRPAAGPMQVYPGLGEPWLAGTFLVSATLPAYLADLPISELGSDPLPPFDFQIVVRDVNDRRLRLQARGQHDGQTVPIWYGDFDWVDGRVVVPLWSHRLVLTRSGQGVTASLEENETIGPGLNSVGALPSPST